MILGTMSDDQEWQPRVDKSFNTFSEGRFAFKGNQSSSGQMLVPALEISCFHTDWTRTPLAKLTIVYQPHLLP